MLHAPLALLAGLFALSIAVASPQAQVGTDDGLSLPPTPTLAVLR